MAHRTLRLALLLPLASLLGCSPPDAGGDGGCRPGEVSACSCADGAEGVQTCGPERTPGPCRCDEVVEPGSPIECETDRLDFGPLPVEVATRRELRCHNRSEGPLALVATVEGDEAFSVEPLPEAPVEAGGSWTVEVTVTPRWPGTIGGTLVLADAGGTVLAEVGLAALGMGESVYCAGRIDFGFVAPGASRREEFVCQNFGANPRHVSLERQPGSDPYFRWEPDGEPVEVPGRTAEGPGRAVIEVYFEPDAGAAAGAYQATVTAVTDDPARPRIDFVWSGRTGDPHPRLACAPENLSFGEVIRGEFPSQMVRCTNVGQETLLIDRLQVANPEFEAEVTDASYRPQGYRAGKDFTVEVAYRPADAGADDDVLKIFVSTAQASAWFEVALSGEGRDPTAPTSCVEVVSSELGTPVTEFDIGTAKPGCQTLPREFLLRDVCDTRPTVARVRLGEGSGEFLLGEVPSPGTILGVATLEVAYRPTDEGVDVGELLVELAGEAAPIRVRLRGTGSATPSQTETFVQTDRECFDLRDQPIQNPDGSWEVEVRIDGEALEPWADPSKAVLNWRYYVGSNAVCFEDPALPPPGSTVEIAYLVHSFCF